ncbi:MAG: heme biosynthesis protein HemY [Gammaproteobacteria bacterium]|nr:heme biosynthesis protein HemY [Gammaproteobacteria bacterium]MDH5650327.1 heme biosynthesis protein HemY [Gammaproteobacteria bacterium]
MTRLFRILSVLLLAVMLGLFMHQDPGYVLIGRGYETWEMSIATFVVTLLILLTLLYIFARLVKNFLSIRSRLRFWRTSRRGKRARQISNQGLIELAQGNWAEAERALVRSVKDSELPLLNYLSAARAAQKLDAPERRDHYLAMAHANRKDASFAVQVTQAELQLAHGQLEQSLATLIHLRTLSPKHPHVLFLLMTLYKKLKSWGDLKELLPVLRKQNVVPERDLHELEISVHRELLNIAAKQGKADRLRSSWQHVPRDLRNEDVLIDEYARHLLLLELYNDAETLLREAVKRHWNVEFVYLYGLVQSEAPGKQLANAEVWLKGHEHNPVLLLTLGRLCLINQLWGKARSYLEASLGAGPRSETYTELGRLLEQLEEPDEARDCFRKGLLLAAEEKTYDTLHTEHDPRSVVRQSG